MSGEVTKTTFELISGLFPWDRSEIVTIIGTDPDGDRVMARDRQGNQQLIPKTFLNPLPSAVRPMSVVSSLPRTSDQSFYVSNAVFVRPLPPPLPPPMRWQRTRA